MFIWTKHYFKHKTPVGLNHKVDCCPVEWHNDCYVITQRDWQRETFPTGQAERGKSGFCSSCDPHPSRVIRCCISFFLVWNNRRNTSQINFCFHFQISSHFSVWTRCLLCFSVSQGPLVMGLRFVWTEGSLPNLNFLFLLAEIISIAGNNLHIKGKTRGNSLFSLCLLWFCDLDWEDVHNFTWNTGLALL